MNESLVSVVDENDLVVRDDPAQHRDGLVDKRLHHIGRIALERRDD
jgi:hypothetical protein